MISKRKRVEARCRHTVGQQLAVVGIRFHRALKHIAGIDKNGIGIVVFARIHISRHLRHFRSFAVKIVDSVKIHRTYFGCQFFYFHRGERFVAKSAFLMLASLGAHRCGRIDYPIFAVRHNFRLVSAGASAPMVVFVAVQIVRITVFVSQNRDNARNGSAAFRANAPLLAFRVFGCRLNNTPT